MVPHYALYCFGISHLCFCYKTNLLKNCKITVLVWRLNEKKILNNSILHGCSDYTESYITCTVIARVDLVHKIVMARLGPTKLVAQFIKKR